MDDNTVPAVIEHNACLQSNKTVNDCTTRIEEEVEVVTDRQAGSRCNPTTSRLCYIADMAYIVPDNIYIIWQTTCTHNTRVLKYTASHECHNFLHV